MLSRRAFIESAALAGVTSTVFPLALQEVVSLTDELTIESVKAAEAVAGLSFTDDERDMVLEGLKGAVEHYQALRNLDLPNHVVPSVVFDPAVGGKSTPHIDEAEAIDWTPPEIERPASEEDLAFCTVPELSSLLRHRKVTSVELTRLYLERLRRFDPVLKCVVTLTEERAFRQAERADQELDAGEWRGPLHGIPWGAKDLLATRDYPTTWGAQPYRDQQLDSDAEVISRLDDAGAVLVAKLTLGALAMGDVWFGGRTNNPWNIENGSSGSSAGSGAAVSAGLVGFAIGSETLGSIVSPSTRNGVTGLRPTFGRVSRSGAMALSWTMDKLGPMCRSAEGCALVFGAIHGQESGDPASVTTAFKWPGRKALSDIRVAYLDGAFDRAEDQAVLGVMRSQGVGLTGASFPEFDTGPMLLMLRVEAAAAFDSLTMSNRDDELTRQDSGAWPTYFRQGRFVPAVEYVNASRARTLLMQELNSMFDSIDVLIIPSFGNAGLRMTNLTGHPSITMPHHFAEVEDSPVPARRNTRSITVVGGLYQDEEVLQIASLFQSATNHHRLRPPIQ